MNTLTMYVATSHGKQNIRVNTIVPGLIITDAVRAHLNDDILAGLSRAILTTHLGEPDDIANLVVFLASDESRYITGPDDLGRRGHVGPRGERRSATSESPGPWGRPPRSADCRAETGAQADPRM